MIEREYNLADLLRRPGVMYADVVSLDSDRFTSQELIDLNAQERQSIIEQIEITAKYAGYIDRQQEEVRRSSHFESMLLPPNLDYALIKALSFEVRQKLQTQKPQTLGQASRISGVTPAAISLLLIHLKRQRYKGFEEKKVEEELARSPA
jgi:tRNA uridine 5-carboxymethylaminomethyl modification enzyme